MRFVIRTEAHPDVGLGHLTRMLALADWLRFDEADVSFVVSRSTDTAFAPSFAAEIERRICAHGLPLYWQAASADIVDANEIITRFAGADWFILDTYTIGQTWIEKLTEAGYKVCVLDDNPKIQRFAHVVVDPTLFSERCGSLREPYCFGGAQYFLSSVDLALRHFLLRVPTAPSEIPALRWFVSFGGTDVLRLLPPTLAVLADLLPAEAQLCIAVSPTVGHMEEIREMLRRCRAHTRLVHDPQEIAAALVTADFAIGAAGGMTLERALVGVPSLVTMVADNQAEIYRRLQSEKLSYTLEPAEFNDAAGLSEKLRAILARQDEWPQMRARTLLLSQGLGAGWLAQYLTSSTHRDIYLRRPAGDFREQLFAWQSIPGVRRYSRSESAPVWEEHCAWYARRQAAHDCVMAEIIWRENAVGMIRLDHLHSAPLQFEISILVTPEYHGCGIARAALQLARRLVPFGNFLAYIHPDNVASRRAFAAAGYVPDIRRDYFRQEALHAHSY